MTDEWTFRPVGWMDDDDLLYEDYLNAKDQCDGEPRPVYSEEALRQLHDEVKALREAMDCCRAGVQCIVDTQGSHLEAFEFSASFTDKLIRKMEAALSQEGK